MPTVMKRMHTANIVSANITGLHLTSPANQQPCFGSTVVDAQKSSARLTSITMECILDMSNEHDNINYTIFLVSLKDTMTRSWNPSTAVLNLAQDDHYIFQEGMCLLNQSYFTIHKVKKLATGNYGMNPGFFQVAGSVFPGPPSDIKGRHRWTWKISPRTIMKSTTGDWNDLVCPADPSKNIYILVANDNSLVDIQNPTIKVNSLHSYKTF